VASDLLGVSGRWITEALIAGQDSPEQLSWKVRERLRRKAKQVKESLQGCFNELHRRMLDAHYQRYEFLSQQLSELEVEIARRMEPYAGLVATIPGVDQVVGWRPIAELGTDMAVFPDAGHCASWAGLSPGSWESAGKQYSGRTKKGNKYLRRILTQAAWAASHCKAGYLPAFFHRVKARRGWGRAIFALAHKILVIAYSILKTGIPYQELGGDYFDRLHPERTVRRLVHRLERLGLTMTVAPSASVTPEFPS
jgi:transposase